MTQVSIPSKSSANIKAAESAITGYYNSHRHRVDEFATDHENTLVATKPYLNQQGIRLDESIPGRHQTLVERLLAYYCRH
jgi:hypothetical protein